MSLREWWARLTGGGDADRLAREEEAIRDARSDPPEPLEDHEAMRADLITREHELPAAETAAEDEAAD